MGRIAGVLLVAVAWLLGPGAMSGQAPAVQGEYDGTLGPLHLVLHVERDAAGKMTGSLDSPDQGAKGIPCADFVLAGSSFSFAVPAVVGSYKGTVSTDGKTITGTWTQGASMPLVLKQAAPEAAFQAAEKPSAVDGDWSGAIATPAGPLKAVIHVKSDRAGKEFVTFDSPSQGAFGLVGENAVLKGDAFSFDLPVVHGRYEGKLSADGKSIEGTWNQGAPLPLTFTREEPFVAAEKPSLVDGDWIGVLATPDGPLRVAMHAKSDMAGKEYVTLDSPDQLAMNLGCVNAALEGRSFKFETPSVKGGFAGAVSADGGSLEGAWTQGSTQEKPLPLELKKGTLSEAPAMETGGAPLTIEALKAQLDAELKPLAGNPALAGSKGIGVAVGVYARGGRRVLTYGVAKPESLFEIGSITKTFTGLILSEMVEAGTVTLETPVRELLPAGTVAKPDGGEITLLSLATHHSGLARMPDNFHPADPANPYADYTEKNLYEYIAKTGVARKADAPFEYSNVGMGLLGEALAKKAGKPYAELLKQDALEPLGMKHTYIALAADEEKNFVAGHDGHDAPVHAWDLDAMAPAGGIRSDARDMLRYVEAQLHPPSGALGKAIEFEHEVRADVGGGKIAINWFFQADTGNYWHDGGTGGFASYAFFDPKLDVGGVVLVNRASGLADSLGMRIAAWMEGGTPGALRR